MGAVTIRNIDDTIKRNARLSAAANGRSLEAELRALLERTYANGESVAQNSCPSESDRAARIRAMSSKEFIQHLIKTANGADIELPERSVESTREIFGAD